MIALIFFSHGRIYNLIGSSAFQFGSFSIGTVSIIFGIWLVAASTAFFALLRAKRDFVKVTGFLNLVALVLVGYQLATAVPIEIGRFVTSASNTRGNPTLQQTGKGIGYKPDIYYIVLDRYAADKNLKDFYGFDNKGFTNYLESKGFYVAKDSLSNYPATVISLSSSLNMTYLDPDQVSSKITTLLQNHELGRLLKNKGYKYLHLSSWAGATKDSSLADINFEEGGSGFNLDDFSSELYQTSALSPILNSSSPSLPLSNSEVKYRNRVLYVLEKLKEVARNYSGPKFVFAHVLLPHDPYVFGPNCEETVPAGSTVSKYLAHVSCANKFMITIIDKILRDSSQPPIIVLQADEGPFNIGYPLLPNQNYREADPRSLQERAGILNAYYLPGVDTGKILYPSITPVNSFRLVLNLYLGTNFEPLLDRSYIFQKSGPEVPQGYLYDWKRPIDKFIDVTDLINQ